MQNLNKKGVSTLVSVVMMIVISLSLGVAFGSFVTGFIRTSLSPEVATCTQFNINIPLKIRGACINQQTNQIEITLERQFSDQKVNSIEFMVTTSQETLQWQCSQSCTDCSILNEGETKTYYLSQQIQGNARIVVKANGCAVDSADIIACTS